MAMCQAVKFIQGLKKMYQFILLIHVFAAIFIIALVLVQQGKGATVGAAFGSGASQTIFGSRGSGSFLFRITFSLLIIFFITSIALNYIVVHEYKRERVITLPKPVTSIPTTIPSTPTGKAPASNTGQGTQTLPNEIPARQ